MVPSLIAALVAAPWRTWRDGGLARPEFLLLAAAGVPWSGMRCMVNAPSQWPPMADPHHQAHSFVMSVVALLIVLLCAGAASPGLGWRVATVTSRAAGSQSP